MQTNYRRRSHYVPRSYLQRWALDAGKLWLYRTMVAHPSVPLWKRFTPNGVGYHDHLYTRIAGHGESDDLEKWFDAEFETPAFEAIDRVVRDQRLEPKHWRRLARFFAAQDLRTPAKLLQRLQSWPETLPTAIEAAVGSSLARLESMSAEEKTLISATGKQDPEAPFRVQLQRDETSGGGTLRAEVTAGRNLWVWE